MFPSLFPHFPYTTLFRSDPFNVTELIVQVSTLSAPALATGTVESAVTIALSVAVQPLGPVTGNRYVPAFFTTGRAVLAPLTMFPSLVLQAKVAPAVLDDP